MLLLKLVSDCTLLWPRDPYKLLSRFLDVVVVEAKLPFSGLAPDVCVFIKSRVKLGKPEAVTLNYSDSCGRRLRMFFEYNFCYARAGLATIVVPENVPFTFYLTILAGMVLFILERGFFGDSKREVPFDRGFSADSTLFITYWLIF